MLEKWRRYVDSGKALGAILPDLSKAFDCLYHELLIAKLNAFGFSVPALRLIHDICHIENRGQGLIIHIVNGLQGSILGPLLFNIFLSDLFLLHRLCR